MPISNIDHIKGGRIGLAQQAISESNRERSVTMQNVLSDGMIGDYSDVDATVLPTELHVITLEKQIDNNKSSDVKLRDLVSQLESIQNLNARISSLALRMRAPGQEVQYNKYVEDINATLDELTSVLNSKNVNGEYGMSGTATDQQAVVNLSGLSDLAVGGNLSTATYYQGGSTGGNVQIDANGTVIEKHPINAAHEGIRLFTQALLKIRGTNVAPDRDALLSEAIGDFNSANSELGNAMALLAFPVRTLKDVGNRLEREHNEAKVQLGNMQAESSIDGMMKLKQQEVVQQVAASLLQQEANALNQLISTLKSI